MPSYLKLASGGNLTLASGGDLLLSGAFLRETQVAELTAEAFDSTSIVSGTANINATVAELEIQAFDATIKALIVILAQVAELSSQAFDANALPTGVATANTTVADLQSDAIDATLQALGVVTVTTEVAQLFSNAIQATATVTGSVTVTGSLAELLCDAIDAVGLRNGVVPNFIPDKPIALKAIREPLNTVTLTWIDGLETYSLQVRRSEGQRGAMATVTTVSAGVQQAVISVDPEETVSFKLIPIGETGQKGQSSYIVYSSPPSKIL